MPVVPADGQKSCVHVRFAERYSVRGTCERTLSNAAGMLVLLKGDAGDPDEASRNCPEVQIENSFRAA